MTSIDNNTKLPASGCVSVGRLACVFNKTTNSYKYIFFQSILKVLHETGFQISRIDFHRLGEEMLMLAWYPHTYYRLSFGVQDQVGKMLDDLNVNADGQSVTDLVDSIHKNREACRQLMRFVPYRLLSVFFEAQLRGTPDHEKNRLISILSNEEFDSVKPIYRLVNSCAIELHEDWLSYLYENYPIVESWVLWKWLDYLQKRNPNVPAISKKLFPPPERHSLRKETEYWNKVSTCMDIGCIYTNESLRAGEFSLDHFLPWSFVGHDRLWNLVPVNKSLNSSKGNRIPDVDTYIEGLIQLQHRGIVVAREIMAKKIWRDRTECFISDLNVPDYNGLLDVEILRKRYQETLYPLAQLAANSGFSCTWRAPSLSAEILELNQQSKVDEIGYREVSYFPDIRIACGHFKAGGTDAVKTVKIPSSYGANPERHFIARASGDSMNGGKNPIKDGDYLLLEHVSAVSAGSITGKVMAIERQDASGDDQYVLRVVKKRAANDYYLLAQNSDYEDFDAAVTMRPFARLKSVLPEEDVRV
jgi:phage repressor protein C with HTH and peptisase S24 domain